MKDLGQYDNIDNGRRRLVVGLFFDIYAAVLF